LTQDLCYVGISGKKSKKKNEDMNSVALRAYELSKLRYYFAIAVTDSPRTAEALYQQLDGIEFEHSAMVFDMRFVPEDVRYCRVHALSSEVTLTVWIHSALRLARSETCAAERWRRHISRRSLSFRPCRYADQ
jgi:hypothetical protein